MSLRLVLGPQTRSPTLLDALGAAGIATSGPIVTVTAGWQEREGEVLALEQHLRTSVTDLRLYARTEQVFSDDPPFREAWRDRQARLRTAQDFYRVRLAHEVAAARELLDRQGDDRELDRARDRAVAAVRRLDREQRDELARAHAEFEAEWRPARRPAIARHLADIRDAVAAAALVLIAGGHVAVLLNRLRLFDLRSALQHKPVAAWSAGAMALTGSVLLFHDRALHDPGAPELFETGLGMIEETVLFPYADSRLLLDDRSRVRLLAARCAPSACYTLDEGEWLAWANGTRAPRGRARQLSPTGAIDPVPS